MIAAGLLLSALVVGCGERGPVEGPLVEVAGTAIDAADLREYRDKLPESHRPRTAGEEAVRELLRALVNREIMVLEGERLGYPEDPEFKRRHHKLTTERLIQLVQQAEFAGDFQVTEEDIQKAFAEYHWNREILPAHIVSATEADAREVIRLLDEGRDFHQLARQRSLADDAEEGGIVGHYFGPNDAVRSLVEGVYDLPVGAHTLEPVRTLNGWEVVKVLDERAVPLSRVRPQLARALHREKFLLERRDFVERLKEKFEVHGDAGESAGSGLRAKLVADSLLVLEARARDMDQSPEYRRFARQLYERMLVTFLRKKQVLERIEVSEEEVAAAYEEKREVYRLPGRVEGPRVVARSAEEGRAIAASVRAGVALKDLARERGLKLDHVHILETDLAYEHFRDAEVGDVIGPIPADSGFEVLRIDTFLARRIRSLDEVDYIVRHRLRLGRIHQSFETYIGQLRRRYEDRVIWHDDRIRRVARAEGM